MKNVDRFAWQRQPRTETYLVSLITDLAEKNPLIGKLDNKLQTITSTRMLDWLDHIVAEDSLLLRQRLSQLGFTEKRSPTGSIFSPHGVSLPKIILPESVKRSPPGIALKVDSIADFLQCNSLSGEIEGTPLAQVRKCTASRKNGTALYAVERRGSDALPPAHIEIDPARYLQAIEKWQRLPRSGPDRDQTFALIVHTAQELVESMGQNLAAHIVCEAERRYWMSRNQAGRIQKMRQDIMGMGWANHDHHTFRSSRKHFNQLINLFTLLGFHKRERFYAGAEAGWGAQVMENPTAGISLFLDVDLAPEEMEVDFSRQELAEREELGSVGLWCALHGDSILGAGMHHLAAAFLFADLPTDLAGYNINFMEPFSDFPYLKQAFSSGERWDTDPEVVQGLLKDRLISEKQADRFLDKGAIGSHLENIQRRDGYKGFNQENVSVIIAETDPRRVADVRGDLPHHWSKMP
ncbi:hypothetical protein [Desulfotalea psychrophila]|uniref:Uncharacterized protein n=1 Tax=Desulfotalea psychrophila (strain LSv54 / DSM 12343) TaxID=177439 RepID=Q6AKR1_DESPS|nr:hypothetical protein [Desulfotalea psychrophila]CAG37064.1 unknown protein [Desulfotalea psychrophila LSv54]